jgi:hypothetical protein
LLNLVSTSFLVHTSQIDGVILHFFENFFRVFFYNWKKKFAENFFADFFDHEKPSF